MSAELLPEGYALLFILVIDDNSPRIWLPLFNMDDFHFSQGNEGIVMYVAGYVAQSLAKKAKCDGCKMLLQNDKTAPRIGFEDDKDDKVQLLEESYLSLVNRGGLVTPTDLVYILCIQ